MQPVERWGGFLPIEDHGIIGDGTTAALIGRDGSIAWLCAPRFDSAPVFCPILDPERGGAFRVDLSDQGVESTQRYLDGSGVLRTDLRAGRGLIRITDALALHPGADLAEDAPAARGELLRQVEVVSGPVECEIRIEPRPGGDLMGSNHAYRLWHPSISDLDLSLQTSIVLSGRRTRLLLDTGERLRFVLRWSHGSHRLSIPHFDDRLRATVDAWQRWAQHISYEGTHSELVRRSVITLKLLDHFESGAIVAAPTSSLPEWPGGTRNWDYRYAWIRDAAFSVYGLRRVDLRQEAWGFLGWVLDAVERHGRPRVLYTLDGDQVAEEVSDPDLRGYLDSRPVRWGNSATRQIQHDVYGEILDCAWQWVAGGEQIDRPLWERLLPLITSARRSWREPDQGIWEVRSEGRPFTYSAALCHVALNRGARLAERLGLPGDPSAWRREADRIVEGILSDAWSEERQAITETLRGGGLDASVLALPMRRVIPPGHPKMVTTCEAVAQGLDAGRGLLFRYLPEESPDGIGETEGAFLPCSFWLVDNLAHQGRLDEGFELFDSLCSRANHLGLLPEELDPSTGSFLGNFPQALSHVGLVSSAVALTRLVAKRKSQPAGRTESPESAVPEPGV